MHTRASCAYGSSSGVCAPRLTAAAAAAGGLPFCLADADLHLHDLPLQWAGLGRAGQQRKCGARTLRWWWWWCRAAGSFYHWPTGSESDFLWAIVDPRVWGSVRHWAWVVFPDGRIVVSVVSFPAVLSAVGEELEVGVSTPLCGLDLSA